MRALSSATSLSSETGPAQCPVPHDPSALNPHNNMPILSQLPAPGQVNILPVTRAISSIPRDPSSSVDMGSSYADDAKSKWEYPSQQQFYNALMRKGWDTPEEHIEAMLAIHNNLNEEAWGEVLKWESRGNGGASEAARLELSKFAGIHGELSHKARLYQVARWFFPSHFIFTPPFDRHDWVVRRPRTNKKVRYVIDYYSLRKDANGDPEFHLDVRPALDNFSSVQVRFMAVIEDMLKVVTCQYAGVSISRIPWFGSRSLIHGFFLVVSLALTIFTFT